MENQLEYENVSSRGVWGEAGVGERGVVEAMRVRGPDIPLPIQILFMLWLLGMGFVLATVVW